MAIGPGQPGFVWDLPHITQNAPHASGVYALYVAQGAYVYFGESNDIQARLLDHLREQNSCIKRNGATSFAFEVVNAQQRVARQNQLIAAYPTPCNQIFG